MDFPLGEGNFGIVYKGVRTKSDGDWEQVPAAVLGNLLIPALGIRNALFRILLRLLKNYRSRFNKF